MRNPAEPDLPNTNSALAHTEDCALKSNTNNACSCPFAESEVGFYVVSVFSDNLERSDGNLNEYFQAGFAIVCNYDDYLEEASLFSKYTCSTFNMVSDFALCSV